MFPLLLLLLLSLLLLLLLLFADDASGAGSVTEVKKWWDTLSEIGPDYGYYPKGEKCWLIVKPQKENIARGSFGETTINITTQGRKHLGAAVGSRSYLVESVNEKVEGWLEEVTKLAKFAVSQPQYIRGIYVWSETPMDIFSPNITRHPRFDTTFRECNFQHLSTCVDRP